MLNFFIGIGRIGKDLELKYLPNGTAVVNFSIACETSFKSGDEWKKQIFWGDVVFFGKRAESISKYLSKGSLVCVKGRLQTRSWDSAGGKQYRTEIIGDDIKFLDGKIKEKNGEEISGDDKEKLPENTKRYTEEIQEEHSTLDPF